MVFDGIKNDRVCSVRILYHQPITISHVGQSLLETRQKCQLGAPVVSGCYNYQSVRLPTQHENGTMKMKNKRDKSSVLNAFGRKIQVGGNFL